MKTVQGICRQYQLVEKTKRKDLDGVVYLVAGERNLWVKLLKDKSSTKREQINSLICQGQSTGFERPLEIVTNEKGVFSGYTFHGPDMEIIPEKSKESYTEQKHLPQFHTSQKNISHSKILQEQMPGSKIQQKQVFSSAGMSGALQWIILGGIGAILFAALALFLDKCFLDLIYTNVSTVAATGCRIIVISEELWKKYKFCACILYCGNHGFCNFCGINIWNSWGSLCVDHRNLWRGSGISGSDFIGNCSGYCWTGRVFIMEKIKMKKHLRIIE